MSFDKEDISLRLREIVVQSDRVDYFVPSVSPTTHRNGYGTIPTEETDNEVGHHSDSNISRTNSSPWHRQLEGFSLPEYNSNIEIPHNATWFQQLLAYSGPGALVAVGYMDPGNWGTAIAGGSSFGYRLLFIVLLSSVMAMFLQTLCLKVGLAANRDLAQCCRDSYPPYMVSILWIITELAIVATDIAEVIGSAIALKLLFGLPMVAGVCITALDVLMILFLNGKKFRMIELLVTALIILITICFIWQLLIIKPSLVEIAQGFIPGKDLFTVKEMQVLAIGIIGATVMPHNLFLHSSIILTRNIPRDPESIKKAIHFGSIDSTISLVWAMFVNASILIVSAAVFYHNGLRDVATLEDAYKIIDPLLNSKVAAALFGIALLASGQNSTLTGTLTGQIVMEGFMTWKINPLLRRLATRLLAILPSIVIVIVGGEKSVNQLLILSQVLLGLALPFAMIPLIHISNSKARMGIFVNNSVESAIAVVIAIIILAMNVAILF